MPIRASRLKMFINIIIGIIRVPAFHIIFHYIVRLAARDSFIVGHPWYKPY